MTFACGTCHKVFYAGRNARDNHCYATGHYAPFAECETCSRTFGSVKAAIQHMDALGHWFGYACDICGDVWDTEDECVQHGIWEHYYCADCQRSFSSYNNAKTHRNSRIHLGQQIPCPFCKRAFTTATGVTSHIEAGSCPSAPNIDRDRLYALVRDRDPNGAISKHLLEYHGSVTWHVSQRTWNGYSYECYICHRGFGKLESLKQHVNSPTHQQTLYHCPNGSCRQEFKTLAGLFNHFESECCGFLRFNQVQREMTAIISSNRRIRM